MDHEGNLVYHPRHAQISTGFVEYPPKELALYSDGVSRDLAANSLYWQEFKDKPVSNAAQKINDAYLKANNQEDGVQSYGRMVDLLLAQFRAEKK